LFTCFVHFFFSLLLVTSFVHFFCSLVSFTSFFHLFSSLVFKDTGATELVEPPAGAEIGERVFVEGVEGDFLSPSQEKKKKAWRTLQPQLGTNDKCFCVWEDKPLMTKSGPVTCASLSGAMLK
jgi:hypothetical protein